MNNKKTIKVLCPNCSGDISECFILSVAAQIQRSKGKERTPITKEEAKDMQKRSVESRRINKLKKKY